MDLVLNCNMSPFVIPYIVLQLCHLTRLSCNMRCFFLMSEFGALPIYLSQICVRFIIIIILDVISQYNNIQVDVSCYFKGLLCICNRSFIKMIIVFIIAMLACLGFLNVVL